jgi:fused signal recognition particle receptor
MAGFFKKLFNRIVGKPTEEAVPVEEVQVALPAPEPEPVVEIVKPKAKKPEPKKVEKAKPVTKAPVKPSSKAKGKTAAPPSKKIEVKKPAAKVPAPKKPEAKKLELKKPEPKKTVPVKKIALPPVVKAKIEVEKPVPLPPTPLPSPVRIVEVVVVPPPPQKPAPVPAPVVEAPARGSWFSRLKEGLSKSSKTITGSITAIFTKRKLNKETLQELEDTLIQADLGIAVSERIIAAVAHGRYDKEIDPEEVKKILADEVAKVLKPVEVPFNFGSEKPFVILVVGVNGSGKTTTIGKLGSIAAAEGFKVMFAACDTFRAAAVEQLAVWGKRIGAVTKSAPTGADAAGLAFDALKQAREDGTDILFIDTAGRLQNKTYLMDELDKVVRVIKKMDPAAPHAVLLVLDATTGQNALAQAEVFTKVAGVTGLIMTKLDGTARGGILVAIAEKFKLPIHAIGVGESIDDLQPFDAQAFARAIAGFED